MNALHRAGALVGVTVALIVGSSIPASATFSDSVAGQATISTGTVAAPSGVTVDDWCVTTTTTTKRTVYTDPVTGVQTQTAWSRTSDSTGSSTNVDSTTSTSAPGPGPNETTTTTVDKDTELHVSVNWAPSGSRGVTDYVVAAHLSNGTAYALARAAGTSTYGHEDADALWYSPRLSVTTMTSYNWTATSALTRVLSC
ncbi:hypothetical protein SAMN04515665_105198 [Blastococcus sp. DSM 46786]|uniref:hypothetical protein n=1 Tax=Blastococcus sp. DSM 46786 TaxID=1798227 RepID=UPI0008CC7A0B|nr:hypothetical protein [Blastococcus sp. DSM 46786]SEK83976.1 hypothetical protein SAMN04515665_105198 [Blastococcus sp. DSM 46786]